MCPKATPAMSPLRQMGVVMMCLSVSLGGAGCASDIDNAKSRDLKIADDELATGNPAIALKLMQKYYAHASDDVPTLVRMGQADSALERNAMAQIFFDKALKIDPSSDAARMGLVRIELKTDPHKALRDIEIFAKSRPRDAKLLSDLGVAYDLCGYPGEAQDTYRRAMNEDPTLLAAQANLGLSLAMNGKPQEGLEFLKPLAFSSDSTKKIRQDYAIAEVLAGNEDAARKILGVDLQAKDVESTILSYRSLAAHEK